MTTNLALRPLIAIALVCFASGSFAAKKKPVQAAPMAPAACVDFYGHVNHAWLQSHPLPAGVPSFSRWDELNGLARRQTADLLAGRAPASGGPASRLLGELAASAADPALLDASMLATAKPLLAQVDGLRKAKDLPRVVASLHAAGVPVVFGFDALRRPDTGEPRASFYPAGLGLPDPAYYGSTEPEIRQALAMYRAYLVDLLKFAGVDDRKSTEQADAALSLETTLAGLMLAAPAAGNDVAVAQTVQSYPALGLADFMQAQGAAPALVNINKPAYFQSLDRMMANKPVVPKWQAYLRTQILNSLADTMGRNRRQPYLAALGLAAAPAPLAAADRLAILGNNEAADLISAAYAEAYMAPADQLRATGIADGVRAAMGRAIDRAAWLSAGGKSSSRAKLAAMGLSIGKPVEAIAFDALVLQRDNFAGNVLALRRWNRSRSLARLNVAIWPWPVSQAQPLIGYQPAENRLIVTAAALRAPAYEGLSLAADHGSFGALLGQQMSLAFADFSQGDGASLASRQTGLLGQYNAYPSGVSGKVNGLRTQRQNAADLAGVELAWDAFQSLGAQDAAAAKEFFRGWAATWARQDSPAALAAAQANSVFAPARWRVNGPLTNLPAFAKTYACKSGAMVRPAKDQSAIWR